MLGRILDWVDERTKLRDIYRDQMVNYKVPKNLTFPYVFGILALITFALQILSGIILIMYYKPVIAHAFDSTNYTIMREIDFGWLFRHIHAAGANFFLAI
ncbi:MAG: cytochrome bc complex cytochrome b subunit, partial [Aquificota bacterium]|nr:cytochrome bc complex cytochrome b subunit [Aquificota bacterium]